MYLFVDFCISNVTDFGISEIILFLAFLRKVPVLFVVLLWDQKFTKWYIYLAS